MPRAILFDLDNTLIDRDAAMRRVVMQRLAVNDSLEAALTEVLRRDASGYADRDTFYAWLAGSFPGFGTDAAEAWSTVANALPAALEADAEVTALVDELASTHALALVSNGGGPVQRAKLDTARLTRQFPVVLISGELGCSKPDAQIFERALAAVGCAAEEALFVGDNPVADIAGASSLGMPTCWVAHGRSYPADLPPPTFTVQHVRNLREVLA